LFHQTCQFSSNNYLTLLDINFCCFLLSSRKAKSYYWLEKHKEMSSSQRAWIVAASVGVVEALKDQGVCRWNHTLKSAQHVIKSHVGSFSQAKNLSFSSSMVSTSSRLKGKQSEESLRTVMYLSCWGPN